MITVDGQVFEYHDLSWTWTQSLAIKLFILNRFNHYLLLKKTDNYNNIIEVVVNT